MSRSLAPATRFRPSAERLEARDCPAVTIEQREQVVFLTGDPSDDRLSVSDMGGGTLEVLTGRGAETVRGVVTVVVDLRGGADAFHFVQAARPSEVLDVVADLGAGDDRVRYDEGPEELETREPIRPAVQRFDVRAGLGNDEVEIIPCIVPGLNLDIRADLGGGSDIFTAAFDGGDAIQLGTIKCTVLDVNGGPGDDLIDIAVGDPHAPAPLLLEDLAIDVRGGRGADICDLTLDNLDVPGQLAVALDLGDGADAMFYQMAPLRTPAAFSYGLNLDVGNDFALLAVGEFVGASTPPRLTVDAGPGDDLLVARSEAATRLGVVPHFNLFGGEGDDIHFGSDGADLIDAGDGDDFISGGDGADDLRGRDGADQIHGGNGADQISGGNGDDALFGEGGSDEIRGDNGDDVIYGGDEFWEGGIGFPGDRLNGGNGADFIRGGDGYDALYGDNGDDDLDGEGYVDFVHGGNGQDILRAAGVGFPFEFIDTLYGGNDADVFDVSGIYVLPDFNPNDGDILLDL
jgi:Ca2+-binding RTX toxin-like protein